MPRHTRLRVKRTGENLIYFPGIDRYIGHAPLAHLAGRIRFVEQYFALPILNRYRAGTSVGIWKHHEQLLAARTRRQSNKRDDCCHDCAHVQFTWTAK